jgi:hypothetical protein
LDELLFAFLLAIILVSFFMVKFCLEGLNLFGEDVLFGLKLLFIDFAESLYLLVRFFVVSLHLFYFLLQKIIVFLAANLILKRCFLLGPLLLKPFLFLSQRSHLLIQFLILFFLSDQKLPDDIKLAFIDSRGLWSSAAALNRRNDTDFGLRICDLY